MKISWNHVETPDCINEGFASGIDVPVCGAVSYHHTFEVVECSSEAGSGVTVSASIRILVSSITSVGDVEL
jgi:hypothetical protein